jgi:pimeloyl-ACP methyl ester carboxylesterase
LSFLQRSQREASRNVETHIEGSRISYDVSGYGTYVLFVHGWAGSRAHWNPGKDFLRGYRTIAPDLDGFGDSDEPKRDITIDDYVMLILALMDKLHVGQCAAVVGHSMGGLIAAQLASYHPDRVNGLVLVEAPVTEELEQVKCPILLVFGEESSKTGGMSRGEMARVQSKHCKTATVAFVDGAAHNPMLENPISFYTILGDFLVARSTP